LRTALERRVRRRRAPVVASPPDGHEAVGPTATTVGAVIVTYNSSSTIGACLAALPVEVPVVVVDNGSADDTVERVLALDRPGLQIVRSQNVGFGAGANRGLRELSEACDLVLVLNPDAELAGAALDSLVRYLADHPTCALVAPRLQLPDGTPLTAAGRRASLATELRIIAPDRLLGRLPDRRLPAGADVHGPLGYVEGACMLLRRAALADVGGFDERYFLFYEEQDLAMRLAARGWTVDLHPTAVAIHGRAVSRASLADRGRAELIASAALYLDLWRPAYEGPAFRALARLTVFGERRRGRLDAAGAAAVTGALRQRVAAR
jgi:GT2 family glycosyltransferase